MSQLVVSLKERSWQTSSFPDMREARSQCAAVGGKNLVVLGGAVWEGKSWIAKSSVEQLKAAKSFGKLRSMKQVRNGLAATSDGEVIYAVGGVGRKSAECSRKGVWEKLVDMSAIRGYCAAAIGSNKLYVFGGCNDSNIPQNSCECMDLMTGQWTNLPPMPTCLAFCCAVTLNDCIYVCGGWDGQDRVRSVYIFHIVTYEWSRGPDMPTKRSSGAAVALHDMLLIVVGGYNPQARQLRSVDLYNVTTKQWTSLQNLQSPRDGCGAAVLVDDDTTASNRKLVVLGGYDGNKDLATCEWLPLPTHQEFLNLQNKSIAELEKSTREKQAKLQDFEKKIQIKQTKIEEQQARIKELEKKLASPPEKTQDVEESVRKATEKLKALASARKAELEEKQSKIEELEKKLANQKRKTQELKEAARKAKEEESLFAIPQSPPANAARKSRKEKTPPRSRDMPSFPVNFDEPLPQRMEAMEDYFQRVDQELQEAARRAQSAKESNKDVAAPPSPNRREKEEPRKQIEAAVRKVARQDITPALPPFPTNFVESRPKRVEAMEEYFLRVDRDRHKWDLETGHARDCVNTYYNKQVGQLQDQYKELETQRLAYLQEIEQAHQVRERHFLGAMGTARTQISALMDGEKSESARPTPQHSAPQHVAPPPVIPHAREEPEAHAEPITEPVPVAKAVLLDPLISLQVESTPGNSPVAGHPPARAAATASIHSQCPEEQRLELAPAREPPQQSGGLRLQPPPRHEGETNKLQHAPPQFENHDLRHAPQQDENRLHLVPQGRKGSFSEGTKHKPPEGNRR